jgi:glycosyltransferase involved in cell wall biosynthesis
MQPRISIIVPCYNGAEYLHDCVKSLMEQTLTEGVEYIFINDASTDNTLDLLRQYIREYPNLLSQIRIIDNEKNLGISETRKLGIRESQGEYIAWVDCDDWVEPNMIESFYNATNGEKIDIVVQNVTMEEYRADNHKTYDWKLFSAKNPYEALKYFYTEKYVPRGLPFQFSRKHLIERCANRIHPVSYTEDTIMLIYLFAIADSCVWLDKSYYHYRIINNSNSLTHKNYKTKEEWILQEKNIKDVTSYLLEKYGKREMIHTVHYIQWLWKTQFQSAFENSWEYWHTFSSAYKSINVFYSDPLSKPWKTWLRYNLFPLYWYFEGRLIFRN